MSEERQPVGSTADERPLLNPYGNGARRSLFSGFGSRHRRLLIGIVALLLVAALGAGTVASSCGVARNAQPAAPGATATAPATP
jgi:hypothetical protein